MEIIFCLQVFTKIILTCESFYKNDSSFQNGLQRLRWKYLRFCFFCHSTKLDWFSFSSNVISKYCSVILRCTLSVSSLSCASCRWSLVDVTIIEEIDAKCQHAREIVRSWLPFDRRTCIVHRCNVFFTDSSNGRLQFYRVNFKTRELITAL